MHPLNKLGLREEEIEKALHLLVDPRKEIYRGNLIPTARTVNIITVIELHAPTILRHNEPCEIFTMPMNVGGRYIETIYMSGTKIAGALRRRVRDLLALYWNNVKERVLSYAKKLTDLKVPVPEEYRCAVVPKTRDTGTNVEEQKVHEEFGYDRVCPACWLFGFAVERGDYNHISQVITDGAYAVNSDVRQIMFNGVSDPYQVTGQALFEVQTATPSVYFVANIRAKDVSPWELMLLLYGIATMDSIGGRKTRLGTIKTYIRAIAFDNKTVITSYELARRVISKYGGEIKEMSLEKIATVISESVKGYVTVVGSIEERVLSLSEQELVEIIENAWYDSLSRRAAHDRYWK